MHQIFRLLLISSALILGIAAASCFVTYHLLETNKSVAHTQEVLFRNSELYSNLQDMNLGSRGYAFTGEKELLEPYNDGKKSLLSNFDKLKELTADNPKQQTSLEELKTASEGFTRQTEEIIKTRSQQLVLQQKGEMDRVRDKLKAIADEEKRLLADRQNLANTFTWIGVGVLGLEVLVALGLVAASWTSVKTYSVENRKQLDAMANEISQRKLSEEALSKERTALAEEVEQRKKTEQALKITTVNLTRSNADLQQFAYVASHDLQEPLRAVTGFLTLLSKKQKDNLDQDSQTYIKHAVEGAQRMRDLVNDLLAYARVESRAKEFQTVRLADVVEQAQKDLSVSIEEKDVTITASDLPEVAGDASQLGLLFQNLLSNAIKFHGEEKPKIDINAQRRPDDWLITVKDNGRGFEMEHAEKIFIIFQRLQGRDKAPGTGIGLAMCKKIVERHGGTIWVDSELDKGSTFYFTLPHSTGG